MTDSLNASMPPSSTTPTPNVNKDGAKVDSVIPVTPPVVPVVTTTTTTTTTPVVSPPAKPSKGMPKQMMFALIGLFILVLGAGVGFYLLGKTQELRQQAAGGYLDCAGGVKDGVKACSGFRAYVTCHNGAFNAATTCPSGQVCDAASSTGCKAETPQSCAGGVPNGGKACDTGTSYVTCTNGAFGSPTKCPTGVTCSGGSCGGSQAGYCDRSGPNTTQCTDKRVGVGCSSTSGVGGSCQQTIPGGANSECTCAPGTPVASPLASPIVACQPSQAACDDGANKCCTGFVCQGSNSSRICQPQTANQCGTGFTCGGGNGWLGFQCDATNQGASGSECLSNMRVFSDPGAAASYANANGCGQVDEVCSSGPQQNKLCGSFQIFSSGCGGRPGPSVTPSSSPQASPRVTPSPSPTPSPTPTPGVTPSPIPSPSPSPSVGPTPSPAPICANISISKPSVVVGDNVTFTCGTVPGATSYEFRVKSPDGTITTVLPVSTNSTQSQSFSIAQQGSYKAQCRICVGTNNCQEWETL